MPQLRIARRCRLDFVAAAGYNHLLVNRATSHLRETDRQTSRQTGRQSVTGEITTSGAARHLEVGAGRCQLHRLDFGKLDFTEMLFLLGS